MEWKAFALAFTTLLVAELGDKTQLAVFSLASQHSALPVFLGAVCALALTSFLGAFFGEAVTRVIPTNTLQLVAGLLFVGIGVGVLFGAVRSLIGK